MPKSVWIDTTNKTEKRAGAILVLAALMTLMGLAFTGCSTEEVRARTASQPESDRNSDEITAADQENIREFGQLLQDSIADGDHNPLVQAFRLPVILETHLAEYPLRAEVLQDVSYNADLLKRSHLKAFFHGNPRFIRPGLIDDKPTALFRYHVEDSFEYLEMILARHGSEDWTIIDTFRHSNAEFFSRQLLAMVLETVKIRDQVFIASLLHENPGQAEELITALLISQAESLRLRGYFAEAGEKLGKIPEAFKNHPEVLLAGISLLTADPGPLDPAGEWKKAVSDFRRKFPDSPASHILGYRLACAEENFRAAHKALDNLEKIIISDPYIALERAILWSQQQDFTKAMNAAQEFVEIEPSNRFAWMAVFQIACDSQNFEMARKALAILVRWFDFNPDQLARDPRYRPFFQYLIG